MLVSFNIECDNNYFNQTKLNYEQKDSESFKKFIHFRDISIFNERTANVCSKHRKG